MLRQLLVATSGQREEAHANERYGKPFPSTGLCAGRRHGIPEAVRLRMLDLGINALKARKGSGFF